MRYAFSLVNKISTNIFMIKIILNLYIFNVSGDYYYEFEKIFKIDISGIIPTRPVYPRCPNPRLTYI